MEKQRKIRKNNFCKRLLGFLFFFISFYTYAENKLTYNMIKNLDVKAVSDKNFAGEECCFELKIPYVKSDDVQVSIPDLPLNVSFVSLRRSDYSDENTGTRIEIWLNFQVSGMYKLHFLRVTIKNRFYNIPFERIEILENPKNILPQMVLKFDNDKQFIQLKKHHPLNKSIFSMRSGESIGFTVYLQYAVQLISFYYDIPKNSLFSEEELYEFTKGTIKKAEFSQELIPVARFNWTPLVEGDTALPMIHAVVTTYQGSRIELVLQDGTIKVNNSISTIKGNEDLEVLYKDAFTNKDELRIKTGKSLVPRRTCERIALYRELERQSYPFNGIALERERYERAFDVVNEGKEPSYKVLLLMVVSCIVCLVLLILFAILKKIGVSLIFSSGVVVFLLLSITTFINLKVSYGIYTGGGIHPVPEEDSSTIESIDGGKRVKIQERCGSWIYISLGNSGGWVDESSVVLYK